MRRMQFWAMFAFSLGAAFVSIGNSYSQAVSGTLNGYVTDPSDAPIAGAAVIIVNEQTGVKKQFFTDSAGFFNGVNLQPGLYTVTAEQPGFSKLMREHVKLEVDAVVRLSLRLTVGNATESITITASEELLQSEKVDVSQTISDRSIRDLPIVGRNVTQLYLTVPGAQPDGFQMGAGENPSGGVRTYINGTWSGAQEFILDGVTNRSYGFSGVQVIVPPADSVQELKITTADYDPEFGSTAGMVAQYVTKSGTNSPHGSVFYYNRNSATFAADPLTEKIPGTGNDGKGTGPAPYNWNQGGFSLGGPIKKNKVFAFGDYQFNRQIQGASIISTVPNTAYQTGDFSGVPHTIYDPNTGNQDGTGRAPFAGNRIAADRINPVSTAILKLLPAPNINNGTDNNYVGSVKQTFNQNWVDSRADWNISDKDKFFGRYSYFSTILDNPGLFGKVAGGPAQGGLSPENATSASQQAALNFVHAFSPSLLAEVRAGYLRFNLAALQADAALRTNDQVGIPGINTGSSLTGGLAGINVSGPVGGFSLGIPSGVGIPRFDLENTFQIVTNWSKMSAKHQLRWGLDFRAYQFDFQSVNASSRGNYNFCQSATGSPDDPGSGLGAATFLLGGTCSFDRAVFRERPHERQSTTGLYLQDVWRLTPRFTLNLGLRWDYFTPVTSPVKGGLANFDPSTGLIKLSSLGNVSNSTDVYTPKSDFAPRVGFAYKVTQSTVIRAGLGRSYFSSGYDATFYHLTSGYPIVTQQQVSQTNVYQAVFPINSPPPAAGVTELPANGLMPAPDGVTLKTREADWKTEAMDSWNFTVEQALGHGATLSVAYVGNKGTHLNWQPNINAANVGTGPLSDRRPYYLRYGLTQGINLACNCSDSNYNGMNVVFNKEFSSFYTMVSNFTWAKAMGYGAFWSPTTYNRQLDYGPGGGTINSSSIDRKFIWITSHSVTIPYGKGHRLGGNARGVTQAVLGGWVFSGITSIESGLAFSPNISSNATLNADFTQRPDPISGMSPFNVPGGQSAAMWYNPAAYSIPTCCRFGYASIGSLRGPGLINADWSMQKDFTFASFLNREATRVRIGVDSFNTWNYRNLGLPNASVDQASAGHITALQAPMRRLQIGAHIYF